MLHFVRLNIFVIIIFFKIATNDKGSLRQNFDYVYEGWDISTTSDYYIPKLTATQALTEVQEIELIENEIKYEAHKLQSGFFTSSLAILFKTIYEMDPWNEPFLTFLLRALESEIAIMHIKKDFDMFGPLMYNATDNFVVLLTNSKTVEIKDKAYRLYNALKFRHTLLRPDINAILKAADIFFSDSDVSNVAKVIHKLRVFPVQDDIHFVIVQETFQAFVFIPCKRIKGTKTWNYLLDLITNSLKLRLGV